jgi:hypothetical protein
VPTKLVDGSGVPFGFAKEAEALRPYIAHLAGSSIRPETLPEPLRAVNDRGRKRVWYGLPVLAARVSAFFEACVGGAVFYDPPTEIWLAQAFAERAKPLAVVHADSWYSMGSPWKNFAEFRFPEQVEEALRVAYVLVLAQRLGGFRRSPGVDPTTADFSEASQVFESRWRPPNALERARAFLAAQALDGYRRAG